MTQPSEQETLEARVRHLMARHAAIKPRGYDTIRARHELHSQIDELLDHHAASSDTAPTPRSPMCSVCNGKRYKNFRSARICPTCDTVQHDYDQIAVES